MCKGEQASSILLAREPATSSPSSVSMSLLGRKAGPGHGIAHDRVFFERVGLLDYRLVVADLRELAVGQRLGEDAVVDEAEGVPFGGGFGLEVPEDPAEIRLAIVLFSFERTLE